MKIDAKGNMNFSNLLNELEDIVSKLEGDDVSLENAFDYYKKGMDLAKACHDKLSSLEKEVIRVTEQDGVIQEDRFRPAGESSETNPVEVPKKAKKNSSKKDKENVRDTRSPIILTGLFEDQKADH